MDCDAGDYGGVVEKRIKCYRGRNRNLEAFFRVSKIVLISFFLLSHYSDSVSAAVEFFQQLLCLLSKPLHVFFVSNVIVLTVAVLSGIPDDGKNGRNGGVADGIYDEYVARRRAIAAGENTLEVSPVVADVPEDEKQIVLFSSSSMTIEGGNGSRIVDAASNVGCTKNGCPRRGMKAEKSTNVASPCGRGRLVLPGVTRGHVLGAPAAAGSDGSKSNAPPWMRMKAEKFTDDASLRGRVRLALPDVVGEHALEAPVAPVSASSTASKHVILKSLSKASVNAKKSLSSANIPSPRGRGRLVAVRDGGSKTVEDMSNDEFNQNVEKYIAKTRRFLWEESKSEIDQSIQHRRSF